MSGAAWTIIYYGRVIVGLRLILFLRKLTAADVHASPPRDVSHDVMRVFVRTRGRHRSSPRKLGEGVRSGEVSIRRVVQYRA